MITSRGKIIFTGLIWLAIAGVTFAPLANAQVHGCTIEQAQDRTNEAEVVLQWSNPHNQCVLISPGTTVTWSGNFNFHPLGGGVSPVTDPASPISSADNQGGSIVLNDVGDYPYFCEIHTATMTGVIYVRASLPAEFGKSSPANGATGLSIATTLSWAASTGATGYEYCLDMTDNNSCDTSWSSTGTNTSTNPAGLSTETDYFWQARANNAGGMTEANGGSWWGFSTIVDPPAAFSKSSPANGATGQPTAATLNWSASTGATGYEYCIDTTDNNSCDASWTSAGTNTSASPAGLSTETDYFWQARAINAGGTTEANGGSWWRFSTVVDAPAAFSKSSPANGATGQPTAATLNWSVSAGATGYEYCIDTTDNNSCDNSWTSTGATTNANPAGLSKDTDYFWQARATNANGTTEADSGSWWRFRTIVNPPAGFNKSGPANGAIGLSTASTLSWFVSTGATGYEYCIDTTDNNTCDTSWTSAGTNTSANPPGLSSETDYFWQARAINTAGTTEANGGSWWRFSTIVDPPAGFNKSSPANGATGQPTAATLNWSVSTGATGYEYCIDTTDNNSCDTSWTSAGTNTSANPAGLSKDTDYFWQVRATNAGGTTEANGGSWWRFRTVVDPPAVFSKSSPANGGTGLSTESSLSWFVSTAATGYEYCIDTTDNNSCDTSWTSAGTNTSAILKDLSVLTDYYWQVRATNGGGTTEANSGAWWDFRTSAIKEVIFEDGFETVSP